MGLAVLRAQFVDGEARQLVVCETPGDSRELSFDLSTWSASGRPSDRIETGTRSLYLRPIPAAPAARQRSRRLVSMLFGDVKGFSKLRESQIPIFMEEVMARLGAVLDDHRQRILHRNTWGDGLYVVVPDVDTAAAIATELQARLDDLDRAACGLPSDLALRLGVHSGPVFEMEDPVLHAPSFIGSHVSRTARIEPVTPPGQVYVSEPFAARIALEPKLGFACEYVGRVPAAKDYGTMRMYLLKRRG
jgi:class 3 adenylate cyclase